MKSRKHFSGEFIQCATGWLERLATRPSFNEDDLVKVVTERMSSGLSMREIGYLKSHLVAWRDLYQSIGEGDITRSVQLAREGLSRGLTNNRS